MKDIQDKFLELTHEHHSLSFEIFKSTTYQIFDNHVPLKKRYVRANQAPFINKNISKEIMKRTRLRNKFFKTKNELDRENYNRHHNFCVTLMRKEKKKYFSNFKSSDIIDNKKIWKTVKPIFTDKIPTKSKIILVDENIISQENSQDIVIEDVISDDKAVSEVFNEFFINIVPNLNIVPEFNFEKQLFDTPDKIFNSIRQFEEHPSIAMIKMKNRSSFFSFSPITYENVLEKVENLNVAKTSQQSDIPTKILKQNSKFFAKYFYQNINYCIENSVFPNDLKLADVTPIHKKKSKSKKDNYRPVSILPNISKVYEKLIYEQIRSYFENILSRYQCGFRKGYNAQHCLMVLIEKWKKSVDNRGAFGA